MKKTSIALAAIYLFSLPLYANTVTLAGGYYDTRDNKSLPLLAMSNNHGKEWSYPSDIFSETLLPKNYKHGMFESTSCHSGFCIAAGSYYDTSMKKTPLIATSSNNGVNWSYVPMQPQYTYTTTTSCTSQFCAVAIAKIDDDEHGSMSSVMGVSKDKGVSWNFSTPTAESTMGVLVLPAMDCTEKSCVVVGWSREPNSPRILISKNEGTTWSYLQLNLPSTYSTATLRAVKCKENICIATGENYTIDDKADLLVLRSTDYGQSWSIIQTGYKPTSIIGIGKKITYTGNTWVISSSDCPNLNVVRPLGLVSQDDGLTWSQPPTLISNIPPKLDRFDIRGGEVSCSGDFCVMPLYITNNLEFRLALTQSYDRGKTWNYSDATPQDMSWHGWFSGSSCEPNHCTIVGTYYSKILKKDKPFIIVSHDYGKNWYTPSTAVSNLPSDFIGGRFHALSEQLKVKYPAYSLDPKQAPSKILTSTK